MFLKKELLLFRIIQESVPKRKKNPSLKKKKKELGQLQSRKNLPTYQESTKLKKINATQKVYASIAKSRMKIWKMKFKTRFIKKLIKLIKKRQKKMLTS